MNINVEGETMWEVEDREGMRMVRLLDNSGKPVFTLTGFDRKKLIELHYVLGVELDLIAAENGELDQFFDN